jgi:regulator of protease activity HflC (stomatin/prohibitin superfamily)
MREQAAILSAEGGKQAAVLRARGEAEAAVLRPKADAEARALRARGEADAITTVFRAIHEGHPDTELLAYQYLQMLPQIAQGDANKVWIVPSELGKALEGLGGFFPAGSAARDRGNGAGPFAFPDTPAPAIPDNPGPLSDGTTPTFSDGPSA